MGLIEDLDNYLKDKSKDEVKKELEVINDNYGEDHENAEEYKTSLYDNVKAMTERVTHKEFREGFCNFLKGK